MSPELVIGRGQGRRELGVSKFADNKEGAFQSFRSELGQGNDLDAGFHLLNEYFLRGWLQRETILRLDVLPGLSRTLAFSTWPMRPMRAGPREKPSEAPKEKPQAG